MRNRYKRFHPCIHVMIVEIFIVTLQFTQSLAQIGQDSELDASLLRCFMYAELELFVGCAKQVSMTVFTAVFYNIIRTCAQ